MPKLKGPPHGLRVEVQISTSVFDRGAGRLVASFTTTGETKDFDTRDGVVAATAPALAEALAAHSRVSAALAGEVPDA